MAVVRIEFLIDEARIEVFEAGQAGVVQRLQQALGDHHLQHV